MCHQPGGFGSDFLPGLSLRYGTSRIPCHECRKQQRVCLSKAQSRNACKVGDSRPEMIEHTLKI